MLYVINKKQNEQGRSMVEMLGTLAIMGVLSAGAIGGYSYAMNKHRTNELIYEATKRAQWVGTQLEMNKNAQNIGFGGFGTDTFGGGKFTGTVKTDLANPNQFGIVVSGLKEAVCENIVKGLESETNGVIRAVKTTDGSADFDQDNCADNAEFLLVFNRDLSTSDSEITATEPEVPATTEPLGNGECSYHGTWEGSYCACHSGWYGETCSDKVNPCSDHGYWVNYGCGSWCVCDQNWGGNNCSENKENSCSGHGSWETIPWDGIQGCTCDAGWDGDDCSEEYGESEGTATGGYEPEETATAQSGGTLCKNNGFLTFDGYCSCAPGWGGSDCSQDMSDACGEHGSWIAVTGGLSGHCDCESGWGGSDCSQDPRAACNNHGTWYQSYNNGAGGCWCDDNWGGSDCSEDQNALYCSGHGTWYQSYNNGAGGCYCYDNWVGSDCSQTARAACSDHGTFIVDTSKPSGGFCSCDTGYTGADCSTPN